MFPQTPKVSLISLARSKAYFGTAAVSLSIAQQAMGERGCS